MAESTSTPPVVDALVELSFTVLGILTRSSAEFDLSVTQLRLLGILRDQSPTMAELAGFLGLDRSSVSGLIDRAEARGLVVRRPSTDDARVTIVDLGPAGAELGTRLAATVGARVERLVASVSEGDRDRVVKIVEGIKAERPESS